MTVVMRNQMVIISLENQGGKEKFVGFPRMRGIATQVKDEKIISQNSQVCVKRSRRSIIRRKCTFSRMGFKEPNTSSQIIL